MLIICNSCDIYFPLEKLCTSLILVWFSIKVFWEFPFPKNFWGAFPLDPLEGGPYGPTAVYFIEATDYLKS